MLEIDPGVGDDCNTFNDKPEVCPGPYISESTCICASRPTESIYRVFQKKETEIKMLIPRELLRLIF